MKMKKMILGGWIVLLLLGSLSACSKSESKLFGFSGTEQQAAQEVIDQITSGEMEEEQSAPLDEPTQAPADKEVRIQLNRYTHTVAAGATVRLNATVNANVQLRWKSSDESVAQVSSVGDVTGVKAGMANITCYTDEGAEAICTVTVTGGTPVPDEPQQESQVVSAEFIFPNSSSAYLTEGEVAATLSAMTAYSPTGNYAQDAINEIYARNGYAFQKAHIRSYYEGKSWYHVDSSFSESKFNAYEKHNIDLFKQFL